MVSAIEDFRFLRDQPARLRAGRKKFRKLVTEIPRPDFRGPMVPPGKRFTSRIVLSTRRPEVFRPLCPSVGGRTTPQHQREQEREKLERGCHPRPWSPLSVCWPQSEREL